MAGAYSKSKISSHITFNGTTARSLHFYKIEGIGKSNTWKRTLVDNKDVQIPGSVGRYASPGTLKKHK